MPRDRAGRCSLLSTILPPSMPGVHPMFISVPRPPLSINVHWFPIASAFFLVNASNLCGKPAWRLLLELRADNTWIMGQYLWNLLDYYYYAFPEAELRVSTHSVWYHCVSLNFTEESCTHAYLFILGEEKLYRRKAKSKPRQNVLVDVIFWNETRLASLTLKFVMVSEPLKFPLQQRVPASIIFSSESGTNSHKDLGEEFDNAKYLL